MKLENTHGDMSRWREVDFALNCTYIVPDQLSDPSFSLPKAMTSIPRNLTFEHGADTEVRSKRITALISQWRVSVKPLPAFHLTVWTCWTFSERELKNTKSVLHNVLLGHLHPKQKICWLMRSSHTVRSLSVCVCVCTSAKQCVCVSHGNFNFNYIRSQLFSVLVQRLWTSVLADPYKHTQLLPVVKIRSRVFVFFSPNCFCSHWVWFQLQVSQQTRASWWPSPRTCYSSSRIMTLIKETTFFYCFVVNFAADFLPRRAFTVNCCWSHVQNNIHQFAHRN